MWVFDGIIKGDTEHKSGLQEQNRASEVGGERAEVLEVKEHTGAQLPVEEEAQVTQSVLRLQRGRAEQAGASE